jgi:hypothetical protein
MYDCNFRAVGNGIRVVLRSDRPPRTLLLKFKGLHHLGDGIREKELKFQLVNGTFKELGIS